MQRTSGDRFSTSGRPLIVAAVHSPETLALAAALAAELPTAAPDLLELRVDHFAADASALDVLAARPSRPLIVTVRHPDEGGAGALDDAARAGLYERFLALPAVAGVDVEIRSRKTLAGSIRDARRTGKWWIASFHDFQGTPPLEQLRDLAGQAADAGADVCKVAAVTRSPGDLATLLRFLEKENRLPLALMGMGPLGKVSRLVLAAAGSVLNYGHLGVAAQVAGQWPVARLRERLDELA